VLLLFLSSELVEARLYRGEVFDCWGHDKPYLALAVRLLAAALGGRPRPRLAVGDFAAAAAADVVFLADKQTKS
jgi:hypothetical protein